MKMKREMYIYTETEAKKLCLKLLESFTNPGDLIYKDDLSEDFERWFKQNKKNT